MRRPLLGASSVLLVAALTAGCAPREQPGFEGIASASPTPALVPAPAGPDPASVPDAPDEAYAEAVADALYAAEGRLLARVLAAPASPDAGLDDELRDGLRALFVGDELRARSRQAEALATDAATREGLLPADAFTGLTFDVERVAYADDRCLVLLVRVLRSGVLADAPAPTGLSALSLSRFPDGPTADNPTAWQARDLLANTAQDGTPNDDSVLRAATLAEFGEALDHTCAGEAARRP